MKYIIAIFLIVPFFFTCISFLVLKKMKFTKSTATGLAADVTTPLLIISIPIIFHAIWAKNIIIYLIGILLIIAIIFTYIAWRTTKEIDIPVLLRKIWRAYFLLLSLAYIALMIVGLIYWMVRYI